jgi:hypothetical protein
VRLGADAFLPLDQEGKPQHTFAGVYREMLRQVCRDYPGLPDPRTLTLTEIRFFYDGLRKELQRYTKPKK